ncbi:formimidoylglutamase [Endozoicomonas sp. Mp262]|uniref:formimidoylglutamase n=1 Tax=Endozoicomonas sp. Mp262 TaxID=2919499 RepID=UPI0021E03DDF
MHQQPDKELWQGRVDTEDGDAGKRWHQHIQMLDINDEAFPSAGAAIIGFCSDEGVKRNKGRVGAKEGPDHIRKAMAGQAWHKKGLPLYDGGNIVCVNQELEASQDGLTDTLIKYLNAELFPVVLGGGHEVAYASGRAVYQHQQSISAQSVTGIINFDAHFDLRLPTPKASSGTPFYQLSQFCQANNQSFNYLCLGISETANTEALFNRADENRVNWVMDSDMHWANLSSNLKVIDEFMATCDQLYLTIDLDVLPAATMPAVSAPASRGVSLDYLERLLDRIIENHHCGIARIKLVDLAECNPRFDSDNRGARVAARLVNKLLAIPFKGDAK